MPGLLLWEHSLGKDRSRPGNSRTGEQSMECQERGGAGTGCHGQAHARVSAGFDLCFIAEAPGQAVSAAP